MRKDNTFNTKQERRENGFSLIELLVVISIAGLLASQAIMEFTAPRNNVKASIMKMRADFNLARAEAINRNTNIRIDFLFNTDIDSDGDTDDGYWICVDNAGGPGCDAADINIKKTAFVDEVEFYDADLSAVGGPNCLPEDPSTPISFPMDGVTFTTTTDNFFEIQPDGTTAGTREGIFYAYIPEGATDMKVAPYAVVVSSTVRIRVLMWKKDSSAWATR